MNKPTDKSHALKSLCDGQAEFQTIAWAKKQSLRLFPTDRPGHIGMDELPNRQTRVLKTLSDGQAEFPTIAWAKSKSP